MTLGMICLIVALVLDVIAVSESLTNKALLCIEGAIFLIIVAVAIPLVR